VTAEGADRFDTVRALGARLLGRVVDVPCVDAGPLPRPALFGGFAFRAGAGDQAPWGLFGDARFDLPRVVAGTDRGRAFVRVTESCSRLRDPAEITLLLDEALGLACSPAPGLVEPRKATPPITPEANVANWSHSIASALAAIAVGPLGKVVLARELRTNAATNADASRVVDRLVRVERGTTIYAFARGDMAFVGATPELLVERTASRVRSEALAGTAPDGESDTGLDDDKVCREHAYVREAIAGSLRPLCSTLVVEPRPGVRCLRGMRHLATEIAGTLSDPVHVVDLARVLHPTPATCGVPRRESMAFLNHHEVFSRGWYAGALGHFDAAGDGRFVVGLRCALLDREGARLFAGAGIVRGSVAEAELDETRLKMRPMWEALGG